MSKHPQLSFIGLSVVALFAVACGGDDEKATEPCPEGTVVGTAVPCVCGDSGVGTAVCQENETLAECVCGGGGLTAGTGAGSGAGTNAAGMSGTAGTTAGSGTSGTGSDDDGGMVDMQDGSVADGGEPTKPEKPKQPEMDGKMLAACENNDDCEGGRICYTASDATPVGYCTTSCNNEDDCDSLGDNYACSTAGLPGTTRYCRISCDGPEDKTCPQFMSCTEVPPGATYRCLYDAKDIGDADKKVFEVCEGTGDCQGDLECFASGIPLNNIGGMSYLGFCTQSCGNSNDCTENPKTGDVAPTCESGLCSLGCDSLLGIGAPDCPDGMECIASGLLTNQCLYVRKASGGI